MEILLIIGSLEALFLILLLLGKSKKNKSDLYLGVILILNAISIFAAYIEIHNRQHNYPFPYLINTAWIILFLHGPFLWIYVKSLVTDKFRFEPKFLIHFITFVFFLGTFYFQFIKLPIDEKIFIAENDIFRDHFFYKITVLGISISTIGYNYASLKLIKSYRNESKANKLNLNWLHILIISSLLCYFFNGLLFITDLIFHFSTYTTLLIISYSLANIYMFFIGYFGIRHKNVLLDNRGEVMISNQFNVLRPDKYDKACIRRIYLIMEDEKLFLQPDLNLTKLSNHLNECSKYISEILNHHLQISFSDFINKYRVIEFKKRCIAGYNKNLSIVGLATECGFNSKASFYRSFKKFENQTPIEFIRRVSN